MPIVNPTPPTPLPVPPSSSDPGNFDVRADTFLGALDDFQTQTNSLATVTYGNALASEEFANLSSQSATSASQSASAASAASNFKGAWSSLTGVLNKPATVLHNNRYWFLLNDLSNVTLSEPGVSADWSPQVLDSLSLGNINLNTVTSSGFYYFGTPTNGPVSLVVNSHLIVSKSGTSLTQVIIETSTGCMFTRGATGIGTTPVFGDWKRVALHADQVVATGGAAVDCSKGNHFTETVSITKTFSFINVPSGSYSCVLEINHTGGTINLPAGTVWAGSAPTFTSGKRHLIFLQKTNIGTAGWYASALSGFNT
jgi:hypothetical protein